MADFKRVAKASDIPPGRVRVVAVAGKRLAVCNVDGTFYAVDDVCTHDGGPLGEGALRDGRIECPRHGALFDVRSGGALTLPAVVGIRTYPVEVVGDDVRVSLDG